MGSNGYSLAVMFCLASPKSCMFVATDVDYALKNIYSVVRSNEDRETPAESELCANLREQESTLELDVIVDDDSSVEVVPARPTVSFETMTLLSQSGDGTKGTKPARVSVSPREIILIDE